MDMEQVNAEKQVWQRVFANPMEPAADDLRQLQLEAAELAGIYRQITGVLTGRQREKGKALYEGALDTAAALKGVAQLSRRGQEVLKVWSPQKEPLRRLLERAYHKSRHAMVEYSARSAEPEFGVVFQKLADRSAAHCVLLAELLGSAG